MARTSSGCCVLDMIMDKDMDMDMELLESQRLQRRLEEGRPYGKDLLWVLCFGLDYGYRY